MEGVFFQISLSLYDFVWGLGDFYPEKKVSWRPREMPSSEIWCVCVCNAAVTEKFPKQHMLSVVEDYSMYTL